MQESYDYIIVGAGSSGCVLANRLSADPATRVLLVESGPDNKSPLIRMPRGIGKLLAPGNPHVWDYEVSPGGNRPAETWLKGRAVGGSSSVNGMVYVRGAPMDYDQWQALGCTGWGWDTIGKCFMALEDHALGEGGERGTGGPLHVTVQPSGNPVCEAVLAAAEEMGVARVPDINAPEAVEAGGLGYQTKNIWKGKRFSAADAFLAPVRHRDNLDILTATDVLKVTTEGSRATGVLLRDKHGTRTVAAREVILSAGAIQSPKLLQLSGIGPGALLRAHGIPVVHDAPGVGQNLREHRYLQTVYRVKGGSLNQAFAGPGLALSVLKYALLGSGPLTHAAHEVGGFVKTEPGIPHANAQIGVSLYSLNHESGTPQVDRHHGLSILGYFTRPESQGEIRIQSADPDVAPFIDANHFSAEIDKAMAVSVMRWLRRLGAQPALKPWIIEEQAPGPSIESDEDILQNAVALGGTAFHICGTCRMGTDAEAVLDPQLRVRGIEGLRVVDTSIMPTIVSGNTNAPAMVIAMNASDMILQKA